MTRLPLRSKSTQRPLTYSSTHKNTGLPKPDVGVAEAAPAATTSANAASSFVGPIRRLCPRLREALQLPSGAMIRGDRRSSPAVGRALSRGVFFPALYRSRVELRFTAVLRCSVG